MNNILLIIKRTYQANFNKATKIILGLLIFLLVSAFFTGPLVLDKNTFPNNIYLNFTINGKNLIITLFVFFISKQIQKDFKKGYLKNLLVNNFTKQQYYFGTVLAWFFLLVLLMIVNFGLVYSVWSVETGFPPANLTTYVLFDLFFFFLGPSAVFWFLICLAYLFFAWQKWEAVIDLILLFFATFTIIWLIILATNLNNQVFHYWQNYLYLILPFYNLIFSVPQNWEFTHIIYWWVYLIDLVYILILVPTFYFCLPKPKMIINGKKSNHYFS